MTGQTPQDGDALREERAMLELERDDLERQIEEAQLRNIGLDVELEHADLAARLSLELSFVQDAATYGERDIDALRELVAKGREAVEKYRRDIAAWERGEDGEEFEHDPLSESDHEHEGDLLTEEYDPEEDAAYHAHLQDMIDMAQAELDRREGKAS